MSVQTNREQLRPGDHGDARETIVPLYMEEVSVSKRVVPKSRVQVSKVTRQHEQLVDEILTREFVEIERTAIGKPIDAMPSVRDEGDTIIVPVVEEVLTIERRLVLKEEVRIRKVRAEDRHQERVTLRQQEVTITRSSAEESAAAAAAEVGIIEGKKEK